MPFIPKWLITIACPIIGIPLWMFVVTQAIGLAPSASLFINLGTEITSLEDLGLSLNMVAILASLALLSLTPTWCNKEKNRDD